MFKEGMKLLQKQIEEKRCKLWVSIPLLEEVRSHFPETKRMSYTGLADWGLRKLLEA